MVPLSTKNFTLPSNLETQTSEGDSSSFQNFFLCACVTKKRKKKGFGRSTIPHTLLTDGTRLWAKGFRGVEALLGSKTFRDHSRRALEHHPRVSGLQSPERGLGRSPRWHLDQPGQFSQPTVASTAPVCDS